MIASSLPRQPGTSTENLSNPTLRREALVFEGLTRSTEASKGLALQQTASEQLKASQLRHWYLVCAVHVAVFVKEMGEKSLCVLLIGVVRQRVC